MAIVTLPDIGGGSDPATINVSVLNGKVDPLATDYNGNIQNVNIASDAGIVDTKLATISTAGKVSGTAITSGDILITNTSTTTIPFQITASSLTTGKLAFLYSNSSSASSRDLLRLHNDHSSATLTIPLKVVQDADYYAIDITATGSATIATLQIVASTTTAVGALDIQCSSLTTGSCARFYSNSSDATARSVVSIVNDHTGADGAFGLQIQQDADAPALYIDYNATVSNTITGLRIDGCSTANGTATVTISNVAPAGVGTATISGWLTVNIDNVICYIPYWT